MEHHRLPAAGAVEMNETTIVGHVKIVATADAPQINDDRETGTRSSRVNATT